MTAVEDTASRDALPPARPSWRLVGALVVGVLATSAVGYRLTGSPSLATLAASGSGAADPAPGSAAGASPEGAREAELRQIAATMVDGIAARLKDRPDDAEGWFMLARSYTVLGRYADSLPAYAKGAQLQAPSAALLADWADATAAAHDSVVHPETLALIDRALALDAEQPKALALSGTVAFARGDFNGAATIWQRLADRLPADAEMKRQVEASIVEARSRGGSPTTAVAAAPDGRAVSGIVTLSPALVASALPTDSVFVFARAASGPRMPLAVRRATVADLPLRYSLDDSMAMTPALTISKSDRVIIGARISKSGNATPQSGDLLGESAAVVPGADGVMVNIDRVVR